MYIVCLSDVQVKSLIQLVDLLTNIAEDDSGGKDGEFVNCRQHALFSLKLICGLLAHQHPRHFVKVQIKFPYQYLETCRTAMSFNSFVNFVERFKTSRKKLYLKYSMSKLTQQVNTCCDRDIIFPRTPYTCGKNSV